MKSSCSFFWSYRYVGTGNFKKNQRELEAPKVTIGKVKKNSANGVNACNVLFILSNKDLSTAG